MCHDAGCAIPDTGCGKSVLGEKTLQAFCHLSKSTPEWIPGAKKLVFKGFGGYSQSSIGVCYILWRLPQNAVVKLRVHVVPGTVGFLISRPALKRLGAQWDMEKDTIYLAKLGISVPLGETQDGDHYEIDLLGRSSVKQPKPLVQEEHEEVIIVNKATTTTITTHNNESSPELEDILSVFQEGRVGAQRLQ